MTLKSHYIDNNTLWSANTVFTSKYWVYGFCEFTKLLLHYIWCNDWNKTVLPLL